MYVGNGKSITTYNSDGKKTGSIPYDYVGEHVVFICKPLTTPVKAKSVSLNKKRVTLCVKEKYMLKTAKTPPTLYQGLSWLSSNNRSPRFPQRELLPQKRKGWPILL